MISPVLGIIVLLTSQSKAPSGPPLPLSSVLSSPNFSRIFSPLKVLTGSLPGSAKLISNLNPSFLTSLPPIG